MVQGFLCFLACHQLRYARCEVDRIFGEDAFDEERLIVEHRAVFLERVLVVAAVDRLELSEQLMMRIQLENTLRLENTLVRFGEELFHRKADTFVCADEADCARFETRGQANVGYLRRERFLDRFEKRVIVLRQRLSFFFCRRVDVAEVKVPVGLIKFEIKEISYDF